MERTKLSMLRRKVAERLVAAKNETAMLTTFNEVNMGPVIAMRNKGGMALLLKTDLQMSKRGQASLVCRCLPIRQHRHI